MSDERLLGVLVEFKSNTEKQLSRIEALSTEAITAANDAKKLAQDSHDYSKSIVQKAGFVGATVSFILFGIFWIVEHIPKAVASIVGVH